MKKIRLFFRYTAFGRILYIPLRFLFGLSYVVPLVKNVWLWTFRSHETDNFTYDLTDTNKRYLAAFISQIASVSYEEAYGYMQEINKDKVLLHSVRTRIAKSRDRHHIDDTMFFGRRIGWYMLVRILKPKIVVETGVEKGLGACVLTSALMKNAQEGYKGFYYGTEIDETAGNLFTELYNRFGRILFGDSIHTLKEFPEKIDLFIHDSDHNASYEMKEYRTVKDKLSNNAYIISDNAHSTDSLLNFAKETKRKFLFFQEKPKNHWYPGAGIGVAFIK